MMLFSLNKFSTTEPTIFSSFSVAFLSNSLCATGLSYYFYLMFRGYGILPFIRKPQRLLMPVPVLLIGLGLATLLKINCWNVILKYTVI